MIIACGTVLFRQHPLEKALEAIRSLGFRYVETQAVGPWCPHVTIGKTDPVAYRDLVRSYGFLGTTALWMPSGSILAGDNCVEAGTRTLEWAQAAGIPVVNTGDGFKPAGLTDDEAYGLYARRMGKLIEAAEKTRTVIALEPHGTFSLTGEGLKRLLSLSDSKWFGVNYDACNIHRAAYVESRADFQKAVKLETKESETEVLGRVIGRVKHVHAKDFRDGHCVALGEGTVRIAECVTMLKQAGYQGAVSLETEGDESFEESVEIARKGYAFLHRLLDE